MFIIIISIRVMSMLLFLFSGKTDRMATGNTYEKLQRKKTDETPYASLKHWTVFYGFCGRPFVKKYPFLFNTGNMNHYISCRNVCYSRDPENPSSHTVPITLLFQLRNCDRYPNKLLTNTVTLIAARVLYTLLPTTNDIFSIYGSHVSLCDTKGFGYDYSFIIGTVWWNEFFYVLESYGNLYDTGIISWHVWSPFENYWWHGIIYAISLNLSPCYNKSYIIIITV